MIDSCSHNYTMSQITKITHLSGRKANFALFEGMHVADIDHFKIDMERYLVGTRSKYEIGIQFSEMPAGGGWDYSYS